MQLYGTYLTINEWKSKNVSLNISYPSIYRWKLMWMKREQKILISQEQVNITETYI